MKPKEKKVSIYQIAESGNLSPATVSRGLRNDPRVTQATRDKIFSIQKMLKNGIEIPVIHRQDKLKNQQSKKYNIALYSESWLSEILYERIQNILIHLGHELTFISNKDGKYILSNLFNKNFDGLIFLGEPTHLLEYKKELKKLPAVQILGHSLIADLNITNVTYNFDKVAEIMISYFDKYNTPIYYFNSIANISKTVSKRANLLKYYSDEVGKDFKIFNFDGHKYGRDIREYILQNILSMPQKPYSICCYNQRVANHVRKELEYQNLKVGIDYNLISCDAHYHYDLFPENSAAVDLNYELIGYHAVEILIERIQNGTNKLFTLAIEPTLLHSHEEYLLKQEIYKELGTL